MTDKQNDPIGKALGIPPLEKVTSTAVESMIAEGHNDSAKKDFEYARGNLMQVIKDSRDAIQTLAQIADSSQHPRAFEVLAKLVDTTVNANKALLDLQSKIRELDAADSPINERAQHVHNNNLFVGSTAELQKLLQDMKKDNG